MCSRDDGREGESGRMGGIGGVTRRLMNIGGNIKGGDGVRRDGVEGGFIKGGSEGVGNEVGSRAGGMMGT